MIDTHAHILKENYDSIDKLVKELKNKNVLCVINCADNIDSSKEVILLSQKYNNYLIPAIGIHPDRINENDNSLEKLDNLLKKYHVVAIGEIGLDYYHNNLNKEIQKDYFKKQISLAHKYNIPVIVHTRESIQDCFMILKNSNVKGVIHCFSGSVEMAREFVKIGFFLGIGGVLTFKNSKLYKVIEEINIDNIVLETDSPYLAPEPFRGTKNVPSNVYYVAQKIAEIKNISVEEVINKTTLNARKLFDI